MEMERRNYRKVFLRLWRNPHFHALDERGKLIALYILAGPQTNRIGLFRVSIATACEDTDLDAGTIRAALAACCAAFGWQWDQTASVVFVPSWWDYNGHGKNDKAWKGALGDLNNVPRTTLVAAFCDATLAHQPSLGDVLGKWLTALTPERRPIPTRYPPDSLSIDYRLPIDTQSRVEKPAGIPNPRQSVQDCKQDYKQEERERQRLEPSVVSLSPAAPSETGALDPFSDPVITERAGRFIERYSDLYQKHRKGARYLVRDARDYQAAVPLCATWTDDARLDKLAAIFLTTDHRFAVEGSRTIPQFAALASWCDSQLAEWEAKQGVA